MRQAPRPPLRACMGLHRMRKVIFQSGLCYHQESGGTRTIFYSLGAWVYALTAGRRKLKIMEVENPARNNKNNRSETSAALLTIAAKLKNKPARFNISYFPFGYLHDSVFGRCCQTAHARQLHQPACQVAARHSPDPHFSKYYVRPACPAAPLTGGARATFA